MKNFFTKNKYLIFSVVAVAVQVLLDQLTKVLAFNNLSFTEETPFLGEIISFQLCYNQGSSFGMMQGQHVLFFIVTLIGLPLFMFFTWRARTRSVCGQIGFNLCVGGTIGNVIDRAFVETDGFFSGKVRDFISYNLPQDGAWHSVFIGNVADIFLVVGVAMAIVAIVFLDEDSLLADIKQQKAVENTDENTSQNENPNEND